jgi:hypothetical protein
MILSTAPIGAKSRRRKQLKERRWSTAKHRGGEDYQHSGEVTLKWQMDTALLARMRFGSKGDCAM